MGQLVKNMVVTDADGRKRQITDEDGRFIDLAYGPVERPHINPDGEFQSDKYPWCKPGFLPLKFTDPKAQDLIALYAIRRRLIDSEFTRDVLDALARIPPSVEELPW